ncbi:MAG: lysophospholipid acyltransferase family protein [Planctomycetota bacterium]
MSLLNNRLTVEMVHAIFRVTSRCYFLGRQHLPARGTPAVLAVAHLSHYDPVVAGALLRRKVDWMARAEFYETPKARWACDHADCVRIDRYGHALPGIREGLRRLEQDRLLGIFPDGEIMVGEDSVLNGAAIKGGAALLARRASARRGEPVPIVPCVVLGSDQFRRLRPWLPLKAGRLWIGLGKPIATRVDAHPGRATRAAVSAELADALREVCRQMRERFDIPDEVLP